MATKKAPQKLSAELLREAEKALKEGTPLPSGVSWNPARNPQFMTAEEAESMGDRDPVEPEAVVVPVEGHSDR